MAPGTADESNGSALVATSAALLVLTYISVALRTYVRVILTKSFQADDWLMLVSQIVFTGTSVFILIGVKEGVGRHNSDLEQAQEIRALMWQALAAAAYILNMMFIKLSIAVFLLRLAERKRYKYILWISMGVVAIWSLGSFFWDVFQCSPVQAQWDYTIPGLKCATSDEVVSGAYAFSIMTVLSDWLYALLPIPMIWKVKMTTQAKVTVVAVLGLGVFASVATLIRIKFLVDLNDTPDLLFAATDALVWTQLEPGIAIIASSLVTIRPLLRKMRIKGFTSTEGSSRPTGARSGADRSMTNRSHGGGSRPGELTLIDLETGSMDQYPAKAYSASVPSTVTNKHDKARSIPLERISEAHAAKRELPATPPLTPPPEALSRNTSRSETFVIEGPRASETWADDPSIASDHEGYGAHSPTDGRRRRGLSEVSLTRSPSSPTRRNRFSMLPIYSAFTSRRR